MTDTARTGTLLRIEPNGFGVVRLDNETDIGVFTGADRSPDSAAAAFRPNARIAAEADTRADGMLYLRNVKVSI